MKVWFKAESEEEFKTLTNSRRNERFFDEYYDEVLRPYVKYNKNNIESMTVEEALWEINIAFNKYREELNEIYT